MAAVSPLNMQAPRGELAGKTALVTGASRGIGAAVARELAVAGAHVWLNYSSDEAQARSVLSQITAAGGTAEIVRASVRDATAVRAMYATMRQAGRLPEIVVNNAAVMRDGYLGMMSLDDWNEVIETNLTGVFICAREAVRSMLPRRSGVIINLSSLAASAGRPGQSNYAAAKAGVEALTRVLALEAGPFGIRVNAVAPGCVNTEMLMRVPLEEREKMVAACPLQRVADPAEIASVVRFLVSSGASYIVGQTIVVDGGLSLT